MSGSGDSIGELKVKVGFDVDTEAAKQEHEKAAKQAEDVWTRAAEVVRRRNEAMQTASAAALLERGVDVSGITDPVGALKAIADRERAEKAASEAAKKTAADAARAAEEAARKTTTTWQRAADAIAQENKATLDKAAVAMAKRGADVRRMSDAEILAAHEAAQAAEKAKEAQEKAAAEAKKAHEKAAAESAKEWKDGFKRAGLAISASLTAAAYGAVRLAQGFLESALSIDRQSRALGMNAQEFQRWQFVAETAGVETDAFVASVAHLQQTASQAAHEGGGAAQMFRRLGIAVKDANGETRSASDLVGDVAERIKDMGAGSDATALAMQVFGEQGRAMLPFLLQGREGVRRLGMEFDELGGGLDDETIRSMREIDIELTKAKVGFIGLVLPIIREVLPNLRELANTVRAGIAKFREMTEHSSLVRAALITLAAVAVGTGIAMAIAYAPFLIALGLIVAAAVLVGLAIDDLMTTFEGGDSVLRRFIDDMYGVGATANMVDGLKTRWQQFANAIETVQTALEPLYEMIDSIGQKFDELWNRIPAPIRAAMASSALSSVPGGGVVTGARSVLEDANTVGANNAVQRALAATIPVLSASPSQVAAAQPAPPTTTNNNQRVDVRVQGLVDETSFDRRIEAVMERVMQNMNRDAMDAAARTGGER